VGVAGDHPEDHPPRQRRVLLDPDGAGSQPERGFELGDAGQGVGQGLALGQQESGSPLLPVGGDVDVLEVGAVEVGGGGVLGPGGHGADHADLGAAAAVGPPRHPTRQHSRKQKRQQGAAEGAEAGGGGQPQTADGGHQGGVAALNRPVEAEAVAEVADDQAGGQADRGDDLPPARPDGVQHHPGHE
jgi:hypothetical protein